MLRPELYLWGSYRTIADNGVKLEFPLSTHSALYISCDVGCSPDKYGLAFMIDDPTEDLHFTDVDHPEESTGGASLQSIAPLTTKTNGTLKKPLWS